MAIGMTAPSILKTGSTISFGAASASVAIPTDLSGNPPNFVRVASTGPCYVKVGAASVTAAAGDLLVQPADSAILMVRGCVNIAAIQVSAAGILEVSPLENL